MSAPHYTIAMVATPLDTVASKGQVLVKVDGAYTIATSANRGTRRSCGISVGPGAVNGGCFMQSFGEIDADVSGLGTGTSAYVRVSATGTLERATSIATNDDIVGWCETDGSCHLFFGVFSASLALLGGIGSMNTTVATTAAATGTILPTTGRVFTVTVNNARNSVAYVFLYDGTQEIARQQVAANSTEVVFFVNGQDLATNLNYSVSSSLASFVADAGGMVSCTARYASGTASTVPAITQVNPNTGGTAGGTNVVLTGVNFTGATQVLFDGVAGTGFTVNSSTQVSVTSPAHVSQSVDVTLVSPLGNAVFPNGFTYSDVAVAPMVGSVSPTFGATAGGTAITILGSGFQNGATVSIAATPCTSVTVVNSGQINCVTGAHASANGVTLQVTNPSLLSGSLLSAYNYSDAAAPTVVSISPTSGPVAGGTSFTLTTTNAVTGATVKFDTASATGVSVGGPTSVTGTTPAHGAGVSSVILRNPDSQTYTLPAAFTYSAPPPTIDPSTFALTGWWDMDDFNIGTQTCAGRASAGTSGSHAMTIDIGAPVSFGATQNGKKSILLADNGARIASVSGDIFGTSGYTFYMVVNVTSVDPLSDNAAAFYQRSQLLATQSSGGIYTALSKDGNIELSDYNGGFPTPTGAVVSQTVPFGAIKLIIGTYDGTNLSIRVGSGTASTKALAGPLTPVANPVRIGYSGSAYPLTGARLLNCITAASVHSPTDIAAFINYYNVQYGLTF